jgi:hypothetical protein
MGRAFRAAGSKRLLQTDGRQPGNEDGQRAFQAAGAKPLLGIVWGAAVLALTGLPLCFLVFVKYGSDSVVNHWLAVGLLSLEVILMRWFTGLRAWQLLASITLSFFILCPVMVMRFEAMQGQTHPPAGLIAVVLAFELWGILAGAVLVAEAIYWVYTRLRNPHRNWRQE